MYDWPVIQPKDASTNMTSAPGVASKLDCTVIITPGRNPCACTMPLGFPVVPLVYIINRGKFASTATGKSALSVHTSPASFALETTLTRCPSLHVEISWSERNAASAGAIFWNRL